MLITTAALVGGFIILSFSGFRMNSDMATMAAITLTLALVLDFLFLPILLINVEENENEAIVFNIDTIPGSATAGSS